MKFCIMHEGMMGDKLKNKYQLTLLNTYLADTPLINILTISYSKKHLAWCLQVVKDLIKFLQPICEVGV